LNQWIQEFKCVQHSIIIKYMKLDKSPIKDVKITLSEWGITFKFIY